MGYNLGDVFSRPARCKSSIFNAFTMLKHQFRIIPWRTNSTSHIPLPRTKNKTKPQTPHALLTIFLFIQEHLHVFCHKQPAHLIFVAVTTEAVTTHTYSLKLHPSHAARPGPLSVLWRDVRFQSTTCQPRNNEEKSSAWNHATMTPKILKSVLLSCEHS